jgi:hypothetical protein
MAFYHIVDNKFWLKNDFTRDVTNILWHINELCKRNYDISPIKLFLSNYKRNEIDVIDDIPKFPFKQVVNYDLSSFQNEYNNYLHTSIILMIKQLLHPYSQSAIIINALFELIKIMERFFILTTVVRSRTKVAQRFRSELQFIEQHFDKVIYRELYLAYLQCKPSYVSTIQNVVFDSIDSNNDILTISPRDYDQVFKLVLDSCFIVDIREIWNLISVSKSLQKLFTREEIMPIIHNNLKDIVVKIYKLNYDLFINHLKKVNGTVSGSSILQSFYVNSSDYIKESDFDVYVDDTKVHKEDMINFLKFLNHEGYEIQDNFPSSLTNGYTYLSFAYHADFILDVMTFKHAISKRSIQVIYVNSNDLPLGEFVTCNYDISFLRNYFDGNDIHIYCLHHIIKKTGVITEKVLKESSYNYDGIYHIEPKPKHVFKYFLFNSELHVRVLKYLKRGFKIIGFEHNSDKSFFY